jgi:hypothetical protein
VYVRSHHSFTRGSSLYVVGEVVNAIGAPVFKIRVTGTFYNNNNQVVATQETIAYLAQTEPDQRNPFKIQVDNPPGDISHYDLSVKWADVSVVSYQDLTVLSQDTRKDNGLEVFGEVRNDFSENLGSIVVVVSFYDAAGEVVDVYQGIPQSAQMAPNETSPYSIQIDGDLSFNSLKVQAQGKRAVF